MAARPLSAEIVVQLRQGPAGTKNVRHVFEDSEVDTSAHQRDLRRVSTKGEK